MAQITISNLQVTDVVQGVIDRYKVTTTSDLVNDSQLAVSSGTIKSAEHAASAVTLTGASGVTSGTYGPSADVAVSGSTVFNIVVPQLTINDKGQVTAVADRTLTIQTF